MTTESKEADIELSVKELEHIAAALKEIGVKPKADSDSDFKHWFQGTLKQPIKIESVPPQAAASIEQKGTDQHRSTPDTPIKHERSEPGNNPTVIDHMDSDDHDNDNDICRSHCLTVDQHVDDSLILGRTDDDRQLVEGLQDTETEEDASPSVDEDIDGLDYDANAVEPEVNTSEENSVNQNIDEESDSSEEPTPRLGTRSLPARTTRRKRLSLLCQIPRLLSSHPDIDHTQDSGIKSLPNRTSLKLASRGLNEKDVLHLINQTVMSLPVNTPCCTLCLKKIRIDVNDTVFEEGIESDVTKTRELKNLSECSSITSESSMEFLSQESSSSFQIINKFHHVNEFLQAVGMRCFSEEERSSWNMYSKSSKSVYCNRLLEVIEKIITTVFPQNIEDVLLLVTMLLSSNDQKQKHHVLPKGSFDPLVDLFQKAKSWRHERQILSFLTQTMSYNQVSQMLQDVNGNKYYAANSHAKIVGSDLPLSQLQQGERWIM
ncbi:unnamed protein product [Mytilus coruscus]|uniref:Uncharacterized protein n=1 Tax=Mytilus coruscus TaxID=42192 RepID=A0A6J8CNN5_MYTCO|nr:unnamed protein product [Mytilus coruscus]